MYLFVFLPFFQIKQFQLAKLGDIYPNYSPTHPNTHSPFALYKYLTSAPEATATLPTSLTCMHVPHIPTHTLLPTHVLTSCFFLLPLHSHLLTIPLPSYLHPMSTHSCLQDPTPHTPASPPLQAQPPPYLIQHLHVEMLYPAHTYVLQAHSGHLHTTRPSFPP